jgi:hypothetical protein
MTNNIQISTNQGVTEPLAADKVVFTPTINSYTSDSGKIIFTPLNPTMYHLQYSTNFRVAAAIDTIQGLYYANWSIVETSFDGST